MFLSLSIFSSKKQKGQGLVEYALILTLVAIVVIAAAMMLGPQIGNIFSNVNSSLSTISSSSSGGAASSTAVPTEDPACAALAAAKDNTNTAYQLCGGNKSKCPSQYAAAVTAWNNYYGAGCK